MKALRLLAITAAVVLSLGACSPQVEPTDSGDTPTTPTLTGEITVFAAASLTNAFTAIAQDFEAANPGTKVTLQFDGSSALATQIIEGANVDVFASADQNNMNKVLTAGQATQYTIFATNNLTLVVPSDNPAHITSIADLEKAEVDTIMCAPEVPCGALATSVIEAADVDISASSLEPNVTAVATKVGLGEADAGFVYTTDVAASEGKLVSIELPSAAQSVTATPYPITVLTTANNELAQAFMDYVLDQGQSTLAQAGFGPKS